MNIKIGKKTYDVYATDFETHNDTYLIQEFKQTPDAAKTSIWLGYLIDDKTKDHNDGFFYSLDSFFEILSEKTKSTKDKRSPRLLIYDFNLAFEWNFILYWLIEHGYHFKEKFEAGDEKVFNSITTKSVSSVWEARIKIHKGDNEIILRDLNKILMAGSLRKVAKSFNLETQKGEIDYRLNRRFYQDDCDLIHYYDKYEPYPVTEEEKIYCFKDVKIIVEILQIIMKRKDSTFFKAISAASYSAINMIAKGYKGAYKPYSVYRRDYPELDEEESNFLRNSVAGGICYPTPNFQFKIIDHPVLHVDAHQMHPTQMYLHKFPTGKGTYIDLSKYKFKNSLLKRGYLFMNKISCVRIKITYTGVRLHSVIGLIGINQSIIPIELTVWDFELPTMLKCYVGLHIEILDAYVYKAKYLPFRDTIAENYKLRLEAKKNNDSYGIIYYKLLNNAFYGKLLERPHNLIYENALIDGIANSIEVVKEDIKINAHYTYIPVGSCVPAYSRVTLVELALKFGWQNVIYFDTDSIFCLYNEQTKKVWDGVDKTDFLGGWGLEEISTRSQFSAPKRYKLEGDKLIVHAAGLNPTLFKDKEFNDINLINEKYNIQRSYKIKGGMIIAYQEKEIKVPDKYQFQFEINYRQIKEEENARIRQQAL